MLREAGYAQRTDPKELVLLDEANGVEFFYLRPRDIAVYVGEGTLDVGITGRDMLLDSRRTPSRSCRSASAAAGSGSPPRRAAACRSTSTRSAAGYVLPRAGRSLSRRARCQHAADQPWTARSRPPSGWAWPTSIADVVETGTTLRQAGLELFGDPILQSEAILIRRRGAESPIGLDQLERRLNGVLVARNYVMMDYDVSDKVVEEACAITPGLESPTVSPLAKEGWLAVRAMVPRAEAQQIMDDLWALGARAILVTDIAACRI